MISRTHRFHGLGSLRSTYRQGKTVRGQFSSIKYKPNPKRQTYRLAVVVSKKVHKSAVRRNRIRRRLYEAVRQIDDDIRGPQDIIITVYHEQLLEMPHVELNRLIRNQLDQAGLLNENNARE